MKISKVLTQIDRDIASLKANITELENISAKMREEYKQERTNKAIEELMKMSNLLNYEKIAGVSANAFAVINPWLWGIIEILDPDIDRD